MDNARIVANVLLAAIALYMTPPYASPSTAAHGMTVFLTSQGNSRWLLSTRKQQETVRSPVYTVTATAYQAVAEQTDDEPFITADNSRIQPHYSSRTRWMALSQDLLAHWGGKFQYGDKVQVQGISPQLDGVYTVHDTMNKRHRHCIDILTNTSEKFDIFTKGVKIQLATIAVDSGYPLRAGRTNALAGPRLRRSARPARQSPQRDSFSSKQPNYFASAIL